jgi:hypothetical protein
MKLLDSVKIIVEETIGKQEILRVPPLKFFDETDRRKAWELLQNFLKKKGNPPYMVKGNLDLSQMKINSLGNLVSVDGSLYLDNSEIETLGSLNYVKDSLYLQESTIQSLGELTFIGKNLNLSLCKNIKSLGKLQQVEGKLVAVHSGLEDFGDLEWVHDALYIDYSDVSSLGNLKAIGTAWNGPPYEEVIFTIIRTPLSELYTKEEIYDQVKVFGKIMRQS